MNLLASYVNNPSLLKTAIPVMPILFYLILVPFPWDSHGTPILIVIPNTMHISNRVNQFRYRIINKCDLFYL